MSLLGVSAAWAGDAQSGDAPQWQTRTEVEEHARDLDRRLIELQHDLLAARHEADQQGMARAEAEVKKVQVDRIETLRTLGELR